MANSSSNGFFSLHFPVFGRLLGNLGWPIILKELRGDFRKSRFFVTHFLCLTAVSIGVMYEIWGSKQDNMTSVQLGRQLFNVFFLVQYFVVILVFPVLTSTAFTEERANKSLGLLMTTDLRPSEIVTGKLISKSAYCLLTVLGTIPLFAISTLFGGVKIEDVFIAYAILIGHTVLISMTGVFVSSCFSMNIRSTLTTCAVIYAFATFSIMNVWWDIWEAAGSGSDKTVVGLLLDSFAPDAIGDWRGREIIAQMIVAIAFVFAFVFVLTMNRIRASTEDKTSGLKLLLLVLVVLILAATLIQATPVIGKTGDVVQRLHETLGSRFWTISLIAFGAALVFGTESIDLSRRVRTRYARFQNVFAVARVFAPGAFTGFIYTALLVLLGTSVLWIFVMKAAGWIPPELAEEGSQIAETRQAVLNCWSELTLTFSTYILAFAALGFYLSSTGFTRGYCFLTVFFIFVITALLPVIFRFREMSDGVFALYYLSPYTLYESVAPVEVPEENAPTFRVMGMAVTDFAKILFGALTVGFVAAGAWRARRRGVVLWRFRSARSELLGDAK